MSGQNIGQRLSQFRKTGTRTGNEGVLVQCATKSTPPGTKRGEALGLQNDVKFRAMVGDLAKQYTGIFSDILLSLNPRAITLENVGSLLS